MFYDIEDLVERKKDEIISRITSVRKDLGNTALKFWSFWEFSDEAKRKLREAIEGKPLRNIFGQTIHPKVEFYIHWLWGTVIKIFIGNEPRK